MFTHTSSLRGKVSIYLSRVVDSPIYQLLKVSILECIAYTHTQKQKKSIHTFIQIYILKHEKARSFLSYNKIVCIHSRSHTWQFMRVHFTLTLSFCDYSHCYISIYVYTYIFSLNRSCVARATSKK